MEAVEKLLMMSVEDLRTYMLVVEDMKVSGAYDYGEYKSRHMIAGAVLGAILTYGKSKNSGPMRSTKEV